MEKLNISKCKNCKNNLHMSHGKEWCLTKECKNHYCNVLTIKETSDNELIAIPYLKSVNCVIDSLQKLINLQNELINFTTGKLRFWELSYSMDEVENSISKIKDIFGMVHGYYENQKEEKA